MDIARLAAKQKRAAAWQALLTTVKDERLAAEFANSLESYRRVLVKCWQEAGGTAAEHRVLEDLERQLVDLDELARLHA